MPELAENESGELKGREMNRVFRVLLGICLLLGLAACGEKAAVTGVEVVAWGPKSTSVGQIPNKTKSGNMRAWFKLSAPVKPGELEVWVGGQKQKLGVTGQKGWFEVAPIHLLTPAKLPMHMVHVPSGKNISLGDFEVRPAAGSAPKIVITGWGPKRTSAGQTFNVRKSGHSSIWFKMTGSVEPGTMDVWFGGKKIEKFAIKSNAGGGIHIPAELIAHKGTYPVYLMHRATGKRYDLGGFEVQ